MAGVQLPLIAIRRMTVYWLPTSSPNRSTQAEGVRAAS